MNGSQPTDARLDWAQLIVRVFLGVVFIAHGSQLLFGAFGGGGLSQTVSQMGPIGYLVAIGQFFGGVGLVLGVLSRFSAASIAVIMVGAILKVHLQHGFWLKDGGFEFNFALIGMALAVLVAGAGRFSLIKALPLPDLIRRC